MTLDAAQHRSGKGAGDENFPVASWLVAPPHRRPIMAFYEFVRIADDIADHPTLSETDKLGHFDRLEASLLGRDDHNAAGIVLRAARCRPHCDRRGPAGWPPGDRGGRACRFRSESDDR